MILRSKLDILLELDLLALLKVQSDVTRLIEEKVVLLELERQNALMVESKDKHCSSNKNDMCEGDLVSVLGEDSDEDDFLLTQFDQIAREKLLGKAAEVRETGEYSRCEPISKKPELSSPLKGTQSLPDSLGSIENDLQIFPPKMKDVPSFDTHGKKILQSSNSQSREASPRKHQGRKKPRLDSEVKHKVLVSFDFNPVTKKPWILEDFRLNEDFNCVRRGRKRLSTMKLNKFYKQGGRPPGVKDEVTSGYNEGENSCEFENLRHRSKSPPGFGRLDFPNTQERVDDKKKSQEIIHKKTRHRFLAATCCEIPQQERQYLFRSDYLNQLVDDRSFEWDDQKLKIFYRV